LRALKKLNQKLKTHLLPSPYTMKHTCWRLMLETCTW